MSFSKNFSKTITFPTTRSKCTDSQQQVEEKEVTEFCETFERIFIMKRLVVIIIFTAYYGLGFSQNKDLTKVKPEKSKYQAVLDMEFSQGSKIKINNLTPQMQTNLELLGRVWGFLKYYHPAVLAGKHNMDAELFRIMPSVLDAKDKEACNDILLQWMDKFGTVTVAKKKKKIDAANVKLYPDLAWIEDEDLLGIQLSQRLKTIEDGKRNRSSYYYLYQHKRFRFGFQNELPYPDMCFEDDGLRLLALFRYWNMMQYYFPYRYLTDKDWNTVPGEFIPKFIDAGNEQDYKLILNRLIAQTCDPHASIFVTALFPEASYILPYQLDIIEGNAIVIDNIDDTLSLSSGLKIGDVILCIDSCTVDKKWIEKWIEEKTPYFAASNQRILMRILGTNIIYSIEKNPVNVRLVRNGDTITTDVNCVPYKTDFSRREKEAYRLLSPDIGYIYPESFKATTLSEIQKLFVNTKGVVIDMRCYPRSSFSWDVQKYLIPEPKNYMKVSVSEFEYPGMFRFSAPDRHYYVKKKNNKDYYKGKVVIIVDTTTGSAGETMAMSLQVAPRATVIGGPTAGSNGNVIRITLPGNLTTRISGLGVYYPDGRETQRVGIAIDEEVKQTLRGVIEGKDELLERAIEIIEKQ